ncbi:MAG: MraY family glycosyltransferase [Candidatus Brocadiia bacterium]
MNIVVLLTCVTAFVITLGLVPLVRKISATIGFVDEPGERKVHKTPIALGGGIALFLGILLTLMLAVASAYYLDKRGPSVPGDKSLLGWLPSEIYNYLPGVFKMLPLLSKIFLAGTAMFFLGLYDDMKALPARTKLIFQIIILTFLVADGLTFSLFMDKYGMAGRILSGAITVGWLVVVTNSFNLLDHMDGLSGGISAIVAAIFLVVALQTGQDFIASFLAAIAGACIAFLIFNFHPARIFMGDAGSLFIGYLIAVLTVLFTFYKESYQLYSIFTPLLVVAIPVFDTMAVIVIRLKNKKPIFKGDMNHFAHRLVALGMSVPQSVLVIYFLTFCTGLSAVLLYHIRPDSGYIGPVIIFAQVVLLLLIITFLEYTGRTKKN